jgi:pyruvate-ferredoxin/flavodoxin oxidoreductase
MEFKKYFLSVDGNTAAAMGAYLFTEVAAIYPITPSSPIAEGVEAMASKGKKNVFGNTVDVVELQSEAGASGSVHGALQAGALASTYTASQGLLLMIPNIYKWVGEELPAVMHVAARALASRALSIFGDHSDVYACRQTGIAMVCSGSVQEVADLAPVAHLIAIEASAPVMHFFDGFRTSHEIQNVEFIEDAGWKSLLNEDAVKAFKAKALNPHGHAVTRGGAENDDTTFQGLEAQNLHNAHIVEVAQKYFKEASELTGRTYAPFIYEGAKDATDVIILMGSACETGHEVVEKLVKEGKKVGMVRVHLYRPFSAELLSEAIPATVKRVAVLDRTKEPNSVGEPLYLDVVASLEQMGRKMDVLVGGRYGIASKDTQPKHIKSVFDFLDSKKPFTGFTVGINDDVTHLSIPVDDKFVVEGDYKSCLFYGLGSDGTVGANKSSCKIIGDVTHQYCQAYFAYDSRKSGGVTRSHLRFGKTPIHSTYYIQHADFISVSLDSYIYKFDIAKDLKDGGTFLLNTDLPADKLIASMPNKMKHDLAVKHAKFYIIDANKIAGECKMGRHTNTILQASFFKLANIMDFEDAKKYMKDMALKTYAKKGDDIVQANYKAIDAGADGLVEVKVDPAWAKLPAVKDKHVIGDEYFDEYMNVVGELDGYDLPVSTFRRWELEDGTMKNDMTYKEKRSIADVVPHWNKDYCIQCGRCAFGCPHATIRAFLLTDDEIKGLPAAEQADVIPALGGANIKGLKFRIQVSPRNCVGCGICALSCPGKMVKQADGTMKPVKALTMVEAKGEFGHEDAAEYLYKKVEPKVGLFPTDTVKGVSLLRPYHEICGACAGCGEAPYYRLASQLFGPDMLVANATGCSSIYNGSTPLSPFTTDKDGNGVAWANSLFEDNAEYGYGMRVATDFKLKQIIGIIEANKNDCEPDLKAVLEDYEANIKNKEHIKGILVKMVTLIKESKNAGIKELLNHQSDLLDKSIWIVGGDGWSYDIGYGGLDHVIASTRDVNILVLDTEVYSNTGGQASKSTQTGAIAEFATTGKKDAKKNLALIAMAYEHVYVANISLGANPAQAIKAFKEAESYNGPSLIMAYSPCLLHTIKGGLGYSQVCEKMATECGYFPIFRYDPRLIEQGKDPLTWDSKEPDWTKFRDFLMVQARYSQLPKLNPDHAEELYQKCEEYAKRRYASIAKMGKL